MKRALPVAMAAMLLASAGAAAQSGRAEISIPATANAIKPQLINEMLNKGYSVMADTPYMITFDRVADNLGAMFLFGTRYGGAPHARISFTMAEINGSTRIVADAALIGNAGTAFERRNDMNSGNEREEVQQLLNTVASRVMPIPPPPPPPPVPGQVPAPAGPPLAAQATP